MSAKPNAAERRRSYRVRYPLKLRPRLDWDGGSTVVVDVSEGGVLCVNERACFAEVGEELKGEVRLRCGAVLEISGRVIRVSDDDAAVSLSRGISFSIILREQRALRGRQRYAR